MMGEQNIKSPAVRYAARGNDGTDPDGYTLYPPLKYATYNTVQRTRPQTARRTNTPAFQLA